MAKRKSVEALVEELTLFNHHEAAAKLKSLDEQVRALTGALQHVADLPRK